ncbi:MAG: hypothetical protein KDI17_10720 [Halioglobus sp.]|nr:hypothetical protein [Halioglobus sp.]
MYRYIVDNAITYTPDDLVLYRESPFAVWMERLTLENPDHGIPPDLDSIASYPQSPQQSDIVATLRAEGRNVALIDADHEEPDRRIATLEAMRTGSDFIVNGQLAVDTLSGTVDLLMRTSGFSELGDFLYIPCDTRADNSLHSPFRLCFAAELLANLQGRLPAQMLIIRGGSEVVPLQTEDHIYYYRAVQKRFLAAMREFRKHRMPDPSESVHFGRWAECASEVLRQRALTERQQDDQKHDGRADDQAHDQPSRQAAAEPLVEVPQLRVAGGAGASSPFDADVGGRSDFATTAYRGNTAADGAGTGYLGSSSGSTLAEQARQLKPGSYRNGKPPGHTPSLARIGKPRIVTAAEEPAKPGPDKAADEALENLEFIGSSGVGGKTSTFELGEVITPAPAPNLRDTPVRRPQPRVEEIRPKTAQLAEREPRPPVFLPPDQVEREADTAPVGRLQTQLPESVEIDDESEEPSSVIDMDSAPPSTLAPVVQRAEAVFKRMIIDDPLFKKAEPANTGSDTGKKTSATPSFSSSLNTSEEYDEH